MNYPKTSRQKREKIVEYLLKNGYSNGDMHEKGYYTTHFKYLIPRVQGEQGCYIKVTTCNAHRNEWLVTAEIKLFYFIGASEVSNWAKIYRVITDVSDMQRVNELAELLLNNRDLIMNQ